MQAFKFTPTRWPTIRVFGANPLAPDNASYPRVAVPPLACADLVTTVRAHLLAVTGTAIACRQQDGHHRCIRVLTICRI
jgi:hypothetical protein